MALSEQNQTKNSANIVLIDDNFVIRNVLRLFLNKLKHNSDKQIKVFTSDEGVEGLGYVYIVQPQMIVIDTTLPKYSGREVIEFLTSNKNFHSDKCKIVVLYDGDRPVDLPENFQTFDKFSKTFLFDLLQYAAKVLNARELKKAKPFSARWGAAKLMSIANTNDIVLSRIQQTQSRIKSLLMYIYSLQLFVLTSCGMTILQIYGGRIEDDNIELKKRDLLRYRARYYPTFVATIFAITVLIAQIILFILGGLGLYYAHLTPVYANWYDTDWDYRKQLTVTGSSAGAQTNYVMQVVVHHGSGTDTGRNVYCESKCKTDFGDIRFATSDETTLLDYYLEEKTDSDEASFWVELDSIPANPSTKNIYVYYGNSGATSASNPDNTFLVWEDFEAGTNIFDVESGGSVTRTEGEGFEGDYGGWPIGDGTHSHWDKTGGQQYSRGEYFLESWMKRKLDDKPVGLFVQGQNVGEQGYQIILDGSSAVSPTIQKDSSATGQSQGSYQVPDNTYQFWQVWSTSTTIETKVYSNSYLTTENGSATLTDSTYSSGYLGVYGFDNQEGYIDGYRIRKRVDPEPTYTSWGSESSYDRDVTVSSSGSQTSSFNAGDTDQYIGGIFAIVDNTGSRDVTSITIREQGTVNAQTNLDNIKLFYENDTSGPYDCASESYAGTETQFGSTDTDGFSGTNGTSTFTGSVGVSTTSTMCVYVVLDVGVSAIDGNTIEIDIADPSTNVVVSAGSLEPETAVAISGTSTVSAVSEGDVFSVQRSCGIVPIGVATLTLTAGVDYTPPADNSRAFVRMISTRLSGVGQVLGGGTQNTDDFTFYYSDPDFAGGSIAFTRAGTATAVRICGEIIEYTGSVGGSNEFVVRQVGSVTYGSSGTTVDTSVVSGVSDDNDVVVFITGQDNVDTGSTNWNSGLSTSEWVSASDIGRFTRATAGSDANHVSYAVVEFVGSNWTVQRVEHQFTAAGSTQTETISNVGATSRAFFHSQHRTAVNGLDEQGADVWLSSTTQVSFLLESGASSPTSIYSVAWVVSNADTTASAMNVQHISGSRTTGQTSEGLANEEDEWSESITTVGDTATTSIMGESAYSGGTGTAYPRGAVALYLNSTSVVKLWQSDDGQPINYHFQVVEWPQGSQAASSPEATVSSTGTQTAAINTPSTDEYAGGAFSITAANASMDITSITITESGTIDAQNSLDNIKLFYEKNSSANCSAESYDGTEAQFGSTDTDGFSGSDGTSTFTGSVSVSTTEAMCIYVVLEVNLNPTHGDTLEISIYDPSTEVVVADGSVTPDTEVTISGTTTIKDPSLGYANGYLYRRSITIDNTKVSGSGDFTDMPVVVSGTYSYLATKSNGGGVENSNGYDIIFTSDSSGETQLDHEIEKYISTTGEVIMWVEIPTVNYSSDTIFYMFYGNSSISSSQENIEGVWDTGYKLVHHLEEGTTGATDFKDSTVNNNDSDAVVISGTGADPAATGKVGTAVQFDGSNDYIRLPNNSVLDIGDNMTIETWIYPEGWGQGGTWGTMFRRNSGGGTGYEYELNNGNDSIAIWDSAIVNSATNSIVLNNWYHAVVVINNNQASLYINGTQSGTTSSFSLDESGSGVSYIGTYTPGTETFDGIIDEVRVSDIPRSADWIQTQYNNQNSPGTFYSIGSEVVGEEGSIVGTYSNGYSYEREITIDNTEVSGSSNLTNFPILVSGTYSYLATTGNGGGVENANGYDIIFTSDEAGSTQLDHEIEEYDPSTGEVAMWVEIPTLDYNDDTVFYMFYGNSEISTSQENVEGVWDTNYKAVHHLEESTTGATDFKDSTSNNNDSNSVSIAGTGANPDATGKVGGAVQFDGSNDYIRLVENGTLDISQAITIEAWVYLDSYGGGGFGSIVDKLYNSGYAYYVNNNGSDSNHVVFQSNNAGVVQGSAPESVTTSSWFHLVTVYNRSRVDFYVNGISSGGGNESNALSTNNANLTIGNESGTTNTTFDGIIDEVRISNTNRSAAWIVTSYNNQTTPSAFYTLGTEESPAGNSAPEVTGLSLNSGSDISLTENTTTEVQWTGTVTDLDGYADIYSAVGKLYRSGATGADQCSVDDNECYADTSCTLSSCSGNSCTATCTANVQFHADATDTSGSYPSQYWLGWIQATDYGNATGNLESTAEINDVESLMALNVQSTMKYGVLLPGEDSGSVNQSMVLTNTGNISIDAEVSGGALCKDYPTCTGTTIPASLQEYSTSSFTYGAGTDLTGSAVGVDVNISKPTQSPSNATGPVYWGISLPSTIDEGIYDGQNIVVATNNN